MRKIQDVLRLHNEASLSARAIARSLNISRDSVSRIISQARAVNLSWPLPESIDDSKLEALLFPSAQGRPKSYAEPDWNYVHLELHRKGVTLQLLWEEYKMEHLEGYQYSQYCEHYRRWRKKLSISLRQEHHAGEKVFVDYSGPTVSYIDKETGELLQAQIFVAVLGASNYTFVEAQPSQQLESFIGGHVRAFEFFDGVPDLVIPDNLKSAVTSPDRYEPIINQTYRDMATHYGTAIMPARPRKPKDKPLAEAGVLLAQRWILAVLRKRRFFSLNEINEAIAQLRRKLNERPFQKLEGSRKSLYEQLDKPALRSLPPVPYEFATWSVAKVNIDYHISVNKAYYSVPYTLVGQQVDVRMTQNVVEIFFHGKRVTSHKRTNYKGQYVTEHSHRPKAHQKHLEWTPSRLVAWGNSIGPNTGILVERIMQTHKHPEKGYRSCLGLLSLSKQYSKARLEAAALRALSIGAISYRSVRSILKNSLEQTTLSLETPGVTPTHENIRGAHYYTDATKKHLLN